MRIANAIGIGNTITIFKVLIIKVLHNALITSCLLNILIKLSKPTHFASNIPRTADELPKRFGFALKAMIRPAIGM